MTPCCCCCCCRCFCRRRRKTFTPPPGLTPAPFTSTSPLLHAPSLLLQRQAAGAGRAGGHLRGSARGTGGAWRRRGEGDAAGGGNCRWPAVQLPPRLASSRGGGRRRRRRRQRRRWHAEMLARGRMAAGGGTQRRWCGAVACVMTPRFPLCSRLGECEQREGCAVLLLRSAGRVPRAPAGFSPPPGRDSARPLACTTKLPRITSTVSDLAVAFLSTLGRRRRPAGTTCRRLGRCGPTEAPMPLHRPLSRIFHPATPTPRPIQARSGSREGAASLCRCGCSDGPFGRRGRPWSGLDAACRGAGPSEKSVSE